VNIKPQTCTYMLIDCKKNLDQSNLTDCKLIIVEGEKRFFSWGAQVVQNDLKFTRY
jgi:hypothetical protein